MISIGSLPFVGCDSPVPITMPKQAVALIPSSRKRTGPASLTVHGYRIYDASSTRTWSFYDVPQLGIRIAAHATLGRRIRQTLAPSSRKVALAFAGQPTPNSYRTVTEDGVQLSIPAGWPVTKPGRYCGLVSPPALHRVHFTGPAMCMAFMPSLTTALSDGVMLFSNSDEFGTQQSPPTAVLHHDRTTVTVYTENNTGKNDFEVLVRRAGSSITHDLVIGLGRDGRVAGGVLASIRATT